MIIGQLCALDKSNILESSTAYAIMTAVALMTELAEHLLVELIIEAYPFGGAANGVLSPARPDDWARVAETAEHHGLAPLLYVSLKRKGRLPELPPGIVERLWADHLRTNVANLLARQELVRLLDGFAAENIPVVLLKGSALAPQVYPDPGLRPSSDLDLLVPEGRVTQVRELLTERGYAPFPEMISGFEQQFSGQQGYSRSGPQPAQVDLHWHLFVITYYLKRIPIDWFWQHTAELEIDGRIARAFTPEAQLLHLSAHYALHHHTSRLIWLYDLALLIASHRDDMNWEEVLEAVRAFELTRAVQSTTAQVKRWWGVSLPADVARHLEALSPGPYERVLFALASGGESQARVILDGLDLPSHRARLRFWLRHMFPTASYMRTRYHISNIRLVPIYYLRRITAGGYRAARAMLAATRRGPNSQVRKLEK